METWWGSETRGTDGGQSVEGHAQMMTQMAAERGSESFCVSLGTDQDEVSFSRRVSVSSGRQCSTVALALYWRPRHGFGGQRCRGLAVGS